MRTLLKPIYLLVALMFSLIASQAGATLAFTTYGTISSGFDAAGLFGSIGDLTGKSYSQTLIVNPALNATNSVTPFSSVSVGGNENTSVADITIVDGHSFVTVLSYGAQNVEFILDALLAGYYDEIRGLAIGTDTNGKTTYVDQSFTSATNHFVPSSSLDQTLAYATQAGDLASALFESFGADGQLAAYFVSTPSFMTLTQADVPEPASLALIAFGLFALASVRRRRQS